MTKPIARDVMYRGRAFEAEVIELCVRWYITYRLSYRDLVEIMAERSIQVAPYHNPPMGPAVCP
jgi:transposase-like protein